MPRRPGHAYLSSICVLSLVCAWPVQADLPRLVVTHFTNTHRDPRLAPMHEELAGDFATALTETGRFEVADAVALGLGTEAPPDFARMEALGVDFLVTGTLAGGEEATWATARFTQVGGPRAGTVPHVVRAASFTVPYVGFLAWKLAQSAREAFALEGKVVATPGGRILVDLGRVHGLGPHDELVVFEVLEEIRSPDTGRLLYVDTREVAQIKPRDIQDEAALCELVEVGAEVRPGMVVRTVAPRDSVDRSSDTRIVVESSVAIPPADPELDGAWFTDVLTTVLARQLPTGWKLLDRAAMQNIVAEHKLQMLPVFDWETAAAGGAQLCANVLVVPTINKRDNQYGVTIRLHYQNSDQVVSSTREGPDLTGLAAGVADDIIAMLRVVSTQPVGGLPLEAGVGFGYTAVPTRQYGALPRLVGDLVTWSIRNTGDDDLHLRLVADVPQYGLAPFAEEITLSAGEKRVMGQTPPLSTASIRDLTEPVAAQVNCRLLLADGAQQVGHWSEQVRLLPPTTWLSRVPIPGTNGELESMEPTLLAWAQESELLKQVRGEAAGRCRLGELPGYQSERIRAAGMPADTPEERRQAVREQVRAVYDVLRSRVRYADQPEIAFPALEGQQVLTPDQVLTHGGANCLDGTLLFAAVLMPVLRPMIIITENHAFVGWQSWSNPDAPWDVLETTNLQTADFDTALAQGWEQARAVCIDRLLEGELGKLDFTDPGRLCRKDEFKLVRAVLDANKAKGYVLGQSGM